MCGVIPRICRHVYVGNTMVSASSWTSFVMFTGICRYCGQKIETQTTTQTVDGKCTSRSTQKIT